MEDNRRYYVYCHTSPSGKKYVGITSQCPKRRWNNGVGYRFNKHFTSAIKKYGWENFSHEILYEDLSLDEACEKEITLISQYKSNNPKYGYNVSSGGEHGFTGCSWTEERKRETRERLLGNKYCLGYKHSPETIRRMSEAQSRRKYPPLTDRLREIYTKNLPPPRPGGSNPTARPVLCVETGVVYSCGRDAAKELGLHAAHICDVCRGNRKSTGGYHFQYYDGKQEEVFSH